MLVSVIGSLYHLLHQSCFIITYIILVYIDFLDSKIVRNLENFQLSDNYRFVCAVISSKTLSGKNSL